MDPDTCLKEDNLPDLNTDDFSSCLKGPTVKYFSLGSISGSQRQILCQPFIDTISSSFRISRQV
jgi:hypothetical protein